MSAREDDERVGLLAINTSAWLTCPEGVAGITYSRLVRMRVLATGIQNRRAFYLEESIIQMQANQAMPGVNHCQLATVCGRQYH